MGLTVTSQVAVLLPSAVVTVIVAVPTALAVTFPLLTVAMFVLLLLQVTFLFVASEGVTVAVKVSDPPIVMLVAVLLRLTPVTGTVTVTAQVADLLPAVAVIVAVPPALAVTLPLASTVATDVSLLDQVTVLSVALLGSTVAESVAVLPLVSERLVWFSVTLVTSMALTVTAQSAVFPPSSVVTVITAEPTPWAVTFPFVSTVATLVLLLLQPTFLLPALSGFTVAVSVSVSPGSRDSDVLFSVTEETGTSLTVTAQVADFSPSSVVTVIVVVPEVKAVTKPVSLTDATAVLLLVQVTFLFAAFSGSTVAVSCCVWSTYRLSSVGSTDTEPMAKETGDMIFLILLAAYASSGTT